MENLFINILLSVLMGIIIFIILLRKRVLRAEEILIPMIAGLCAVFPASLLEYALSIKAGSITGLFKTFVNAFIIASFIEETAKFLVIKALFHIKKINNLKDGIAIAIAVGTGFACLENIMYSFDSSIAVMFRVFTAMPIHIITAGIIGYFAVKPDRADNSDKADRIDWANRSVNSDRTDRPDSPVINLAPQRYMPFRGFAEAVFIHGFYNLLISLKNFISILSLPLLLWAGYRLYKLSKNAVKEKQQPDK